MQRVLENIFSRWVQLVALLFVPLIIALGIVMMQPRQYEASATLWALRRYAVVGATGPEQDLTATPASTQALAITGILQTKTFALAVGHEANLASTYSAATRKDPDLVDETIFEDISTHVVATAVSYNLVSITYDNRLPAMAKSVTQAVITQYGRSAAQFATSESTQLLLIYQQQLAHAQEVSNKAADAASAYLRDHPGVTTQSDPQYAILANNAATTLASVNTAQETISQINTEIATIGTGSNTLFAVVDAPSVGVHPVSRSKIVLAGSAIGLVVGLLACILFILILMRRDRAIYSVAELHKITDAAVLLQIPLLPSGILVQTVNRLGSGRRYF
jgi:hypothetical protein